MKRMHVVRICVAGLLIHAPMVLAAVRYVKPTASGSGDCSTWANACALATAMDPQTGLAQSGDEVWVQEGTYSPFALKTGVKVYGGFAGTETTASQSQPATHPTIIDGGSTQQCVTGSDNGASTVLRGFTLRNGAADEGGALFLNNSSAVIVYCTFENNTAGDFGGAVAVRGSGSPHFVSCTFRNNGNPDGQRPYGGGAVFVHRGSPTFTNCLFYGNKAGEGGVLLVAFGTPTLINCTMVANQSGIGYGGALHDQDGRVTLKNCILWDNVTTRGAGEADQIFSGSGGTTLATYCDIQGGWIGTSNLNADPLFNDAAAFNFRLQQTSPCIDTGQNEALPPDVGNLDWDLDTDETVPRDVASMVRTIGTRVDIGAHETAPGPPPGPGGGGEDP